MKAAFSILALLAAPAALSAAPAPAAAVRACEGAYLGVFLTEASDGGAEVVRLMDGATPARDAGLQAGDRIVSFAGHDVDSVQELVSLVKERSAGDQVEVVFYRGGEKHHLAVELKAASQAPEKFPTWEVVEPAQEGAGDQSWTFEKREAPAQGMGGGGGVNDERWAELLERHAATAAEWWEDFEERMEELQERLDERWDDLSEEIDELLAERSDPAFKERMARVREELARARDARIQRMEEVRAKMKAAEDEVRARLEALRSDRGRAKSSTRGAPEGGGGKSSTFTAPDGFPFRLPTLDAQFGQGFKAQGSGTDAGEIKALREEVKDLRGEIQELKDLLRARTGTGK